MGLIIALVTLIADQAHKVWMLEVLQIGLGDRITVTSFLDLVYVANTGISYGWLSLESQNGQFLLAGFAVLASIALAIWLFWIDNALLAVAIGLIMGGAIGNAIDRVRLGAVADFYSVHVGNFYWYVFNIADVAIVAGVIGLLYDAFILSRKRALNTR